MNTIYFKLGGILLLIIGTYLFAVKNTTNKYERFLAEMNSKSLQELSNAQTKARDTEKELANQLALRDKENYELRKQKEKSADNYVKSIDDGSLRLSIKADSCSASQVSGDSTGGAMEATEGTAYLSGGLSKALIQFAREKDELIIAHNALIDDYNLIKDNYEQYNKSIKEDK